MPATRAHRPTQHLYGGQGGKLPNLALSPSIIIEIFNFMLIPI